MKSCLMKIAMASIVILLVCGGCSYLNKRLNMEDDNVIEETAEAVIEHHTGIDIDLTPFSKE